MGTQLSGDTKLVRRSRASVRRFIRAFLAINDTPYWFHQTLTFKDAKTNEKTAKRLLYRLLDSLGKVFPDMPALFVEERQKQHGIHYHVIFLLFGTQPQTPEATRTMLAGEVFPRWNSINGGELVSRANQLKLRQKNLLGLRYLLKGVVPTSDKASRQSLWHGVRKGKLIRANSKPAVKQELRGAWDYVFGPRNAISRVSAVLPVKAPVTKQDIAGMKAYLEWTGAALDWERQAPALNMQLGKAYIMHADPKMATAVITAYDSTKGNAAVDYCLKREFDEYGQDRERHDDMSENLFNYLVKKNQNAQNN